MKNENNVGGHSTLNNKDRSANTQMVVSQNSTENRWVKRHKERIRRYKSLTMSVVAAGLLMATSTSCEKIDFLNDFDPQPPVGFDITLNSISINDTLFRAETLGDSNDGLLNVVHAQSLSDIN
ncbi:MAG: hypothetical protein QNK23_15410 [Crocinitomicaceae bacterium]|nr:hypothetical protein [Crocinitomicaceae bacterium]